MKNPGRAALATISGGLSEVARITPGLKTVAKPVIGVANSIAQTGLNTISMGTYGVGTQLLDATLNKPNPVQGAPMALNIGGILNTVSSGLGGFKNPATQLLSLGTGIASNFFPQPGSVPVLPMNAATPVAAKSPGLPAITGSVGTAVGRGFFNRFPNLSVSLQQLRNRGIKVNRSRLYTILRRFGPEVLISGGLLTAAAVNELMVAGAGRRRMNVGNVKALKRSMRRMEGFHKLCVRADALRSRGKRRVKC